MDRLFACLKLRDALVNHSRNALAERTADSPDVPRPRMRVKVFGRWKARQPKAVIVGVGSSRPLLPDSRLLHFQTCKSFQVLRIHVRDSPEFESNTIPM
jgi:hypothetical protein